MTEPDLPHIVVRPATRHDLAQMAAWQYSFLPHGLFPRLGERFIRHWHATFLDSPFGIAIIADLVTPGRLPTPVGFLVGSTDQVRHVDDVVRRSRFRLGTAGAAALVLRPRLAAHFLRTRAKAYSRRLLRRTPRAAEPEHPRTGTGADGTMHRSGTAVITAVAVSPEARGRGAGTGLIVRFLDIARTAGSARAELVVMTGTGGPETFYKQLGWTQVERHLSKDGSLALTFRYQLDGGAPE